MAACSLKVRPERMSSSHSNVTSSHPRMISSYTRMITSSQGWPPTAQGWIQATHEWFPSTQGWFQAAHRWFPATQGLLTINQGWIQATQWWSKQYVFKVVFVPFGRLVLECAGNGTVVLKRICVCICNRVAIPHGLLQTRKAFVSNRS